MTEIRLRKCENGALYPSDEQAEAYIKRFKIGSDFAAEIKMKRNGKHHRLGMSMLQLVFQNQDRHDCFDAFMIEVKILTGYVDTHLSSDGAVYYLVKSIAFDKMDELAFGRWKNDALSVVFNRFIPDMSEADQERVINNLIARM